MRFPHTSLPPVASAFARIGLITLGCSGLNLADKSEPDRSSRQLSDLDVIRNYGGLSSRSQHDVDFQHGKLINLTVKGREGFLIVPHGPVHPQRRWVWIIPSWLGVMNRPTDGSAVGVARPEETIGVVFHEFYVEELLARGYHVAGVDVGVSCGSVPGVEVCHAFYKSLVNIYKLNPQARLIGQSNGGLIAYAWAWRHPRCVDRIAGIFPATDMRSWPGLDKACGPGRITPVGLGFNLTVAQLEAGLKKFNPIDNLAPLADAGVEILHIHGDRDGGIPVEQNSEEFVRRFRALGGRIELDVWEGFGHGGEAFYRSPRVLEFLID